MIEETEISKIKDRVFKIERQNQRLTWRFRVVLALWLVTLAAAVILNDANAEVQDKETRQNITQNSVLRLRGLVIVDENGKERVQLGAPLPDPLALGKRTKRQGPVSGILLMDAEGNERSGYVTNDVTGAVYLTLDNVGEQTAMFYANHDTGANFYVRDSDNENTIRLDAYGKNPSIKMYRQGKIIFQAPETTGGK
ncbi:MAG TPA: hypothetical protein VEF04_04490 [Blastocatellia bacterium]|nr:hypothetical protein [Blastocatellia bacterium]